MDLFVLRKVVVANKRLPTLVTLVPLVIVMDSQVKSTGKQLKSTGGGESGGTTGLTPRTAGSGLPAPSLIPFRLPF